MAEELGSAELRLTANDKDLRDKLQASKTLLNELGKDAAELGTSLSKAFSKEFRLRLNDSQLIAANTRVDNLQKKLASIASQPVNVRLNLITGGDIGGGGAPITREAVARRAREALSSGLSAQYQQILASGVGGVRAEDLRATLLARIGRGSLSSGGFNVAGLREVVTQLGGTPSGSRAELLKQAQDAVRSVNDAVIEQVGRDLLDLRMMFSGGPPPGGGGGGGGGGGDRLRQAILDKQVSLQNRLNVLEARGVDVAGQRARLAAAAQAAQEGELRAASQTQRILSRNISVQENALRVQTLRAGAARTPEQVLAGRGGQQRGAAVSLTAPEKALDKVSSLRNRINVLTARGVDSTSQLARLASIEAEIAEGRFATAQRLSSVLSRDVKTQETGLRIARLQQQRQARRDTGLPQPIGPVSPVLGGPQFPGSPNFIARGLVANPADQRRQLAAAARRRQDITSNALIGGAFPLLFGQGLGASLGGAAGGGLGGAVGGQFGFGLSLLGTAVGAQFDAIIQKATLLGQALDNPIKNFAALQQGALLSSKGLERQVESLLAVGREAEAAALIQQDLARSYGGAEAAKSLAASQDQLNRSWTQLSVGLAQLGLPVLAVAATDAANSLTGFLAVLQRISNLQLPEAPTRLPTGGEIAGGAFRIGRASAGGGAAGFFSAVGTEVLSFLGVNRPNAPTSPQAATSQSAAAESRRNALLSAQYRLITAQVQGYKDLSLAAEKQVSLEQEREDIANLLARGLKADDPQIEQRRAQGAQERFKLEEEQGKLQRDNAAKALKDEQDRAQAARETAAAYQLISAESKLQLRTIEQQIRDAQALAAAPAGPIRDTLRTRQQVASEITAARNRVLSLGDQIGAARLRGDETEAFRLVQEQQTAAKGVELSLTNGATALRDAAQQLRDSALETQRSLENLRGGNLEFLNPRDQERLLLSLRAQAEPEARRRDISLRSTGGIAEEINLLNRFLNFTRSESQLLEQGKQIAAGLEIANRPLLVSNETLGTSLSTLTASVDALTRKDWSVYVNGQSTNLPAQQQATNNAAIS